DVARHNVARGAADLRLFETGTVFRAGDEPLPHEHASLAVLLSGRSAPPTWGAPEPAEVDFYAGKATLEALATALRVDIELRRQTESILHPGCAAAVLAGGDPVGWLGELHPIIAADWDLAGGVAFEIDLDRFVA